MMKLLELPEEILIIIIRLLDSQSTHNLYNTCKYLRQLVCQQGVIKKIILQKNALATVYSLKLNFFNDIAPHLQELNLSGLYKLKKSYLMPLMKKMKCLKTLDITYTSISIIDFIELYQFCPTIKNVGLNFMFGKLGTTTISHNVIVHCQNILKNFKNIHFVGSVCNLLNSDLSLYMLSECKLNSLKYSVSESNYAYTTKHKELNFNDLKNRLHFDYCNICILNWREKNKYYQNVNTIPFLLDLDFKSYEYIITSMLNIYNFNVFISPIFKSFFCENFNIEAEVVSELEKPLFGNISIMLWDKKTFNFDSNFFMELYNNIRNYFPTYCKLDNEPVSLKSDWFYILPKAPPVGSIVQLYDPTIPKRRMANPDEILNYDSLFRRREKIMLSVIFHEYLTNAVGLSKNCDYLPKLTYLSLSGIVRYNADFFNILFTCCINLVTLNVEATSVSPCVLPISRNIHLNKQLKNIRLVDRKIDFKTIISALSKCRYLENINLFEDTQINSNNLADASILLEKCPNLYSLFMEAPMSESECVKYKRLLTKTANKYRKYHVNILLQPRVLNDRYRYYYDPHLDVFNLSAIKQF